MTEKIEIDLNKLQDIGNNVKATLHDELLILIIDPAQTIGLSSTGKMMGIASTNGFVMMPGGLKGNLYIGKKA